jgi:hypothetical protein
MLRLRCPHPERAERAARSSLTTAACVRRAARPSPSGTGGPAARHGARAPHRTVGDRSHVPVRAGVGGRLDDRLEGRVAEEPTRLFRTHRPRRRPRATDSCHATPSWVRGSIRVRRSPSAWPRSSCSFRSPSRACTVRSCSRWPPSGRWWAWGSCWRGCRGSSCSPTAVIDRRRDDSKGKCIGWTRQMVPPVSRGGRLASGRSVLGQYHSMVSGARGC